MSGPILVHEAAEWREPAPGGGSQAQIFRLTDGRFVVVKFPENRQGELVLANEYLSCQLAGVFDLPVNRAIFVSIDERLIRAPRLSGQVPADFSAGVRCGMIYYEKSENLPVADFPAQCVNADDLHGLAVFEQLVARRDGRQTLVYPDSTNGGKRFAAFDYGYSFAGEPAWSASTLAGMPAPVLPDVDPYVGTPYADGKQLAGIVDRFRSITTAQLAAAVEPFQPPRWGIRPEDIAALVPLLFSRAQQLVDQFDVRFKPQIEAPLEVQP